MINRIDRTAGMSMSSSNAMLKKLLKKGKKTDKTFKIPPIAGDDDNERGGTQKQKNGRDGNR